MTPKSGRTKPTAIEPFSDGYYLLGDVRTVPSSVGHATIPNRLMGELWDVVGHPLLYIDDEYYWPAAEEAIPAETVAMPLETDYNKEAAVLMARRSMARDLVRQGIINHPNEQ